MNYVNWDKTAYKNLQYSSQYNIEIVNWFFIIGKSYKMRSRYIHQCDYCS